MAQSKITLGEYMMLTNDDGELGFYYTFSNGVSVYIYNKSILNVCSIFESYDDANDCNMKYDAEEIDNILSLFDLSITANKDKNNNYSLESAGGFQTYQGYLIAGFKFSINEDEMQTFLTDIRNDIKIY
jgi:hypothetical protein